MYLDGKANSTPGCNLVKLSEGILFGKGNKVSLKVARLITAFAWYLQSLVNSGSFPGSFQVGASIVSAKLNVVENI